MLILGPVYAVIYYVVFRASIRMFDLKTPGRESEIGEIAVTGAGEGGRRSLVLTFRGAAS